MNDVANLEEGSVRLVEGATLLEGRLEILHNGLWGTVCDYNWDLADATVVCHQLGYPRAVGAPTSAIFGPGSGVSWYSYVGCVGTEVNLTECSKSLSSIGSSCSHSRDAGVVCSSELQSYSVCFYLNSHFSSLMIVLCILKHISLVCSNFTIVHNTQFNNTLVAMYVNVLYL